MNPISDLIDSALAATRMDAVDALRAFFIFAFCTILSVSLPQSLRSRFVPYGARATSTAESNSNPSPSSSKPSSSSPITRPLDCLAALKVPHGYFTQFYVASVISSLFWAVQVLSRGAAFQAVAARIRPEHLQNAMSLNQVLLCWALMLVQGTRRLVECLALSKPSSSQMWFGHWLVGVAFYVAVSVAIWIEGTGTLLAHEYTLDHVKITNVPSIRTFLCLPIFMFASGLQHDCHYYLFSLQKYTVPAHPLFNRLVCPHYTAECAIYLSLTLLAAPPGEWVNKTLLSALAFVAINLGVTAGTSRKWYAQKFGEESVRNKWNMIPGVY
ncbi:protein DFG10 [Aspergillus steynii IBT 23096]|uniref:Polyprenal reductase n=1 Tax=Aspergillus steynii IBT 23096 TaxID=1392250 RepID=A0A2I2G1L8_9EURO|nr:protein DFG10 [Aspergillus steynii IBT 23096]PLB46772.1 protein DFG10 [Aspergillus steynii IBT 23096]